MTCSPNDLKIDVPEGNSGVSIPGFGVPFAIKGPDISKIPIPSGFPEDLVGILNNLQFLIPPGALKAQLNPNFSKDIFDGIMSLLDQFMPFLMLYKFFLPVLNIIVCIIEVLCAIANPFKLIAAIKRLFRKCIPEFLNIFPVFAMVIMMISILQLLLAFVEYMIEQVEKFVKVITRNIKNLYKAFHDNDENSALAVAKKLGTLLCAFQNFFVLFSVFSIIIQVIKDILGFGASIPPCDDTATDPDNCCGPDVCPSIVKDPFTRLNGKLQYLNRVATLPSLGFLPSFAVTGREESFQLYDVGQLEPQQFKNIYDAYDVDLNLYKQLKGKKPIFFPTDVSYNLSTAPNQAAYTVDVKVRYNPANWGRPGADRIVQFTDCIVRYVPKPYVIKFNTLTESVPTGVITIIGGLGYEEDGIAPLFGYAADGVTQLNIQATLNSFFHQPDNVSLTPIYLPTDGYLFSDVEYKFSANHEVLVNKAIITSACEPGLALTKGFINAAFTTGIGEKSKNFSDLVGGVNGAVFPDPASSQECLTTGLTNLRNNMSVQGAADFQSFATVCLTKLKNDANSALAGLIGIGFEPCKSAFSLTPTSQFTSKTIKVQVSINERNGLPITNSLTGDTAENVAARIKGYPSLGEISKFVYDGYQVFAAEISSSKPGKGQMMVSFDNNIFCTNVIPSDITIDPSRVLQTIDYQFVYSGGVLSGSTVSVGEGDTSTGSPIRDESDLSKGSS